MTVYGKQACLFVLSHAPDLIREVYLSKRLSGPGFDSLSKLNNKIVMIDNKIAQSMSRGGNHQGVIFVIRDLDICSIDTMKSCNKLIVLSGVSDIGNVGQIVRTAYAMGVDGVILSDRNSLSMRSVEGIFRASSGSMLNLKVSFARNSLDVANELKIAGFRLVGSLASSSESRAVRSDKWALFAGGESLGLRNRLLEKMDDVMSIQMKNGFDSLNVGVAVGILVYMLNQ